MTAQITQTHRKKSNSGLLEKAVSHSLFHFIAYYDRKERLIFVLDSTKDALTPSDRLIIAPYDRKKWDEILREKYKLEPDLIRPRKGHLYQPLDIEYENLHLYDTFLKDISDNIAAKNIVLNREKQSLKHAVVRLNDETDTLHKAQATVMSSRKSVEDFSARMERLKQRQKAMQKKKKENPKSVKLEQEEKLHTSIDRNNEALKERRKRLRRAEKRVEKSKEHIAAIKERLDHIKEKLAVYKQQELETKPVPPKPRPTAPFVQPPKEEKKAEPPKRAVVPPTPLPHTPTAPHHFWDIHVDEHGLHIFHIISLCLIALLILFFIVLRSAS